MDWIIFATMALGVVVVWLVGFKAGYAAGHSDGILMGEQNMIDEMEAQGLDVPTVLNWTIIDSAAIYNRELTPEEVSEIHKKGL